MEGGVKMTLFFGSARDGRPSQRVLEREVDPYDVTRLHPDWLAGRRGGGRRRRRRERGR